MEENEREADFLRRRLEEEDVAVREEAAGEAGAWRDIHGKAEGADGDLAVVADAHGGTEAPDEAPPRAGWRRTEFAVDFVRVGVGEDVEEGLFLPLAGEPCVGRGVVLPERAEVAGLPAAHGLGGLFVAGVRGEAVSDGPAVDTGAVGLEMETAQESAGDGAGGGAGRGGKQAGGERDGLRWPVWMMIATRSPRLPGVRLTESTSAQIRGAKFVNPGAAEAELQREIGGGKLSRAKLSEEMAEEVGVRRRGN